MIIIILLVMLAAGVSSTITAYGATVDYYEIMAGDTSLAKVDNLKDAQAIIDRVTEKLSAGAEGGQVKIDPAMVIESRSYKPKTEKAPEITYDIEKTVEAITADYRTLKVTVKNLETREEEIDFTIKEEETDELLIGEERIEQQGVKGLRTITEEVTLVNGKETRRKEVKNEVTLEPVEQIVLKGTKEEEPEPEPEVTRTTPEPQAEATSPLAGAATSVAGATGQSSPPAEVATTSSNDAKRQEIVNYALQFVGNPYAYGGTSLTNGADCSGFVYRVYQDFGYNVPRVGFEDVYPRVQGDMKPGDIIVYPGHYTMYIGNGQEVHASDYGVGIIVSSVGRPGKSHYAVRVIQD